MPEVHSGPRRPLLFAIACIALAAGGVWVWRHQSGEDSSPQQAGSRQPGGQPAKGPAGKTQAGNRTVPVLVAEARKSDFPMYLTSLGNVQALRTVTVRSRVSGEIQKIGFREGQLVHEGDLIAELDPRPLQAALDQAKSKLAQDEATQRDAEANLKRYQELAEKQFVSRQQLDSQNATVNQGTALIEGDRAAVQNAETQLGYATIRAPITGRAGFRLVDVGNIVNNGEAAGIVTIQQISPISVVFTAPESRIQDVFDALKTGAPPVTAFTNDGRSALAEGTLRLTNNEVDAASGTIRLKATFPNTDETLWPGLSVQARLLLRTVKDGTVVEERAVQRGPEGLFAYVVGAGDKAEMRKIEVADTTGGEVLVTRGIAPGDTVIVDGQYRVEPGSVLDPKPDDRQDQAEPATAALAPATTGKAVRQD
jgi:membrane fusion protein, multidrug efflux system